MRKVFKKSGLLWLAVGLVVVSAGAALFFGRDRAPSYVTYTVVPMTIVQQVSATGNVVAAREADLGFIGSGRVTTIFKNVGATVAQGDLIVSLDTAALEAQKLQAQAALASQQAQLAALVRGARPEEIAIKQGQVTTAVVTLNESQKALANSIRSAYTVSDDAVHNSVDQIFTNPRSTTPQVSFSMSDSQLQMNMQAQRYVVEQALIAWNASLGLFDDATDISRYAQDAAANLNQVKILLDQSASAVNSLVPYGSISQATITGWKTTIAAARVALNAAIAALSGAQDTWRGAAAGLQIAQDQLALTNAGATQDQIDAQRALVLQAQAQVQAIDAQIEQLYIRSPFEGTVMRQDAKLGETVHAGVSVASIMAKQGFQIDANIAEADIAKVTIGNAASVTLDAYGSDIVFNAHVVQIAPQEVVIEGVPTYKTTLYFDKQDNRIKSGMTANLDIVTARKDNVLAVPQRAVIVQDRKKSVRVVLGNQTTLVDIQTGIRGANGFIEVADGLAQGMHIVANP